MAVSGPSWRVLGASVQGVSHLRSQEPCQDRHQWLELAGGTLVLAVADGAGSAKWADHGAETAVTSAIAAAVAKLGGLNSGNDAAWDEAIRAIFREARHALVCQAEERDIRLNDLATTLLVAIASWNRVAAGQIGDGAVVVHWADGTFASLTRPVETEYLNETTFLTMEEDRQQLQVVIQTGDLKGLALLTDGLEMLALKMPQATPHLPFFEPLFRFLAAAADLDRAEEQLRAFLQSPRITQRADDDLTLVLAVPKPERA